MPEELRYRGVWYNVTPNKIYSECLGLSQFEGWTEFSKYFMQASGETYQECEDKIKKGIDMMKDYENKEID